MIRDGNRDLLLATSKGLHEMFSPKATELFAPILGEVDCKSYGAPFCSLGNGCKLVISSLF